MDLHSKYLRLFEQNLPKIANGEHLTDSYLDAPSDNRYGLSLILQLDPGVNQKVQQFLLDLQQEEPDQYYYTPDQIHITVLSIISCCEGFKLDSITVPDYAEIIEESLQGIKAFEMTYRGITASNSGLLLQGFPKGDELDQIRENLRINLRASGLRESIDQRYKLSTAHATIMRFRTELQNSEQFVKILQNNRESFFGTENITRLHLVYNDWYHRAERTRVLRSFCI